MNKEQPPIYEILLFTEIPTLDSHGWPSYGNADNMGFYYELETAIQAMHENWCDIQETIYRAGFILKHYPGLYPDATSENRIYFEWDAEREGFFEKEEPELFKHFSY